MILSPHGRLSASSAIASAAPGDPTCGLAQVVTGRDPPRRSPLLHRRRDSCCLTGAVSSGQCRRAGQAEHQCRCGSPHGGWVK